MHPLPDCSHVMDERCSFPDFTTLLTEAIQLYADAVAVHALRAEGVLDTGEEGESVEVARTRLRCLLSLIPPLPAPAEERLAAPSSPAGKEATDFTAN